MRPYERGAATPCISCQRGLSTVEFHEGRLAEARTARPPTRLGCVTLAGRKRITTRQTAVTGLCSPGCDGPKREDKSETEETCSADSRRCSGPSATPRPPVHGDFFLGPSYTYLIACVRTPPFSSAVRNLTWVTARVQKQR